MKVHVLSGALAAAVVCAAGAQEPRVGVLHVQGNVYVLATAAGNVALQIGAEGALIVDTASAGFSGDILAAVRTLTDKPIRWIVNTHAHADHIGGNEALSKAGSGTPQNRFGSGRAFPGVLASGANIVSHEAVLTRLIKPVAGASPPQAAWPTMTYLGEGREMFFNEESIQILHEPAAHSDGDSIVYFRRSDVICTGDIFSTTGYPVIDLDAGGTINGVVAGLNHLLDIAIPKEKQEGGTYLIPGHGRLSDEADLVQYRNMVTIIRDRIRDLTARGMTLDQVKAAKPTAGYDRRWSTPSWTGDMFVEAAYRSLLSPSTTAQR
jgi:glyoxylase-like metal-dependent hydrolase (beta-lactamase superfamily II)